MFDNQPAYEVIKKRRSMRSYTGRPLSAQDKAELQRRITGCLQNPFGAKVRLMLVDSSLLSGKKLGTYGVIHGAEHFIAGVALCGPMDAEGLGFSMEHAVLAATAMELGTCWLAGTYNRSDFMHAAELGDDEKLVAISPAGYPAEHRTVLDTVMHSVAGSSKRKPWSELFFEGSPALPLTGQAAGEYWDALEAVRLAPSAANGQPWRIIKAGNRFHFYRYAKPGSNAVRVDMGIAACHFELVAREAGLAGEWIFSNPDMDIKGEALSYFASWVTK